MNLVDDTHNYEGAISQFCHDNFPTTIFMAGEISHPGISDLDFLIIDKSPKISDSVKPFLAGGNVIVMPREHFRFIDNIEQFKLKRLQGEELSIDPVIDGESFSIIEVIEWLPERILKCEALSQLNVNRRDALLLHKSICRSIKSVEKIVGDKYQIVGVNEARSCNSIIADEIISQCVTYGQKAWQDFETYVYDNKIISGSARGKVAICDHYSFNDKFQLLLLYFGAMLQIDCGLSSALSRKVSVVTKDLCVAQGFSTFSRNRWTTISDIYDWFVSRKMTRGMIKYGWLL